LPAPVVVGGVVTFPGVITCSLPAGSAYPQSFKTVEGKVESSGVKIPCF